VPIDSLWAYPAYIAAMIGFVADQLGLQDFKKLSSA
jgi:hypothetical protein